MNALTTIETAIANSPDIATLLPPDVPADKFRSVALAAIRNNPELLKCDQRSLFNACLHAAQDGLLPDGREGAIVPRKNKAVWQPMIHGIFKRIKSGGSVSALSANVVYEGEAFAVELGDADRIVHRRDLSLVKRGREVAVYAIATMKDGSKEREVMTWDQVDAVRKSSAMPNSGPWTQWGDEMARKTVVKRLAKRLPVIEPADEIVQRVVNRVDSLYDFGTKPEEIHDVPEPETQHLQVGQSALNQAGLQVGQQGDLRSAYNVAVPMKAAAASVRAEKIVDKSKVYEGPHPLDEKDPRLWLINVETELTNAQSQDEVVGISDHPTVKWACANAPDAVKRELSKLLADAYGRFAEPLDVQTDLPDVEIAGQEKVMSG